MNSVNNSSNDNVSSVNNDLVWSVLGNVWISKTDFLQDEGDEWSDIEEEEEEEEEEVSPLNRRRRSWQDIAIASSLASRKKVADADVDADVDEIKEVVAEELINPECTNECAICYDCFTKTDACSTTPCGHKFHSKCLFQNFEHRPECPLCRTELIKQPEEEDDDVQEGDGSSFYSEDEDDDDEPTQIVSMKQMADKLTALGYTMEDLLMLHFGGSDHPKDIENPRWQADLANTENELTSSATASVSTSVGSHILEYNVQEKKFYPESKRILVKLNADIDNILEGNLAVKYTDTRTYAQVLASVVNQ